MSAPPHPPVRKLPKYIQCPSGENAGASSAALEFTFGPSGCGGPHASSTLARCETQMSRSPNPPGRSVLMYKLSPCFEIAGSASMKEVLITGPRLSGSGHGPYAGGSSTTSCAVTAAAGATGLVSGLHATAWV